jgi:predicted GH43/DUF377 family glycosyl hydrolase
MNWVKKGLIFVPCGKSDWMVTHAAVPFADRIGEDIFRVYFCSRDEKNRAQVGYFEIDITRPEQIIYQHDKPVIDLGPLGTYDDSGAISSWIVNVGQQKYCYYSGITLGVTVPFYFYLGMAISEDGGRTFCKVSDAPILARSSVDPYLTGHACVMSEGDLWRMWYVSGQRWDVQNGQPKHYYHIKYAESTDGLKWDRRGVVCIDFKSDEEYAIGRPCVIKENGFYSLWYSYRGQTYRIGYAKSPDGIHWERKDEQVGIDVSSTGWDSEMIEYAHVFDHKGERYMLYNGNGYGKTGIGLAALESD